MLSIVIPSRNEMFLQKTIIDLLEKAKGEVEIVVVLDGYWPPTEEIVDDERVIYLHKGVSEGMREGINSGVAITSGKYIMKIDGHCMMDEGYDLELIKVHEDDWVQVPTRRKLDAENWCNVTVGNRDINYMYLSYPDDPNERGGIGLHGKGWGEKNTDRALRNDKVVDLMSAQGSCYFLTKKYFYELDLLDNKNYGPFGSEFQEVGLKCWLSGGRVVRNKNTVYYHLHKGKRYGRGYYLNNKDMDKANQFTNKWIKGDDAWDKQTLPLQWLIKYFWPVPGWTKENYKILFGEDFDEE